MIKCNSSNIANDNEICKLFSFTFKGRIQGWYKTLTNKYVHYWEHFINIFLSSHNCYDYDNLFLEIRTLYLQDDKSIGEFYDRFKCLCFNYAWKIFLENRICCNAFNFLFLLLVNIINITWMNKVVLILFPILLNP